MNRQSVFSTVKTILWAGALAAGLFSAAASPALAIGRATAPVHSTAPAHSAHGVVVEAARSAAHLGLNEPVPSSATVPETPGDRADAPGTTPFPDRPWIEGYEPAREDALFRAAYPVLASHNILKIYVSNSAIYGAAGIRFSGRVPHSNADISKDAMEREAATLIRTAFERFPDLQTLDVWATVPVDTTLATSIESTVFSISADRATYLEIRKRGLSDDAFLAAFGRVWIAPQVPQ